MPTVQLEIVQLSIENTPRNSPRRKQASATFGQELPRRCVLSARGSEAGRHGAQPLCAAQRAHTGLPAEKHLSQTLATTEPIPLTRAGIPLRRAKRGLAGWRPPGLG